MFLTALVTVIGGALTLAVGQIIVRGGLEPQLSSNDSSVRSHPTWISTPTDSSRALLLKRSGETCFESIRALYERS